MFLFLSGSDAV